MKYLLKRPKRGVEVVTLAPGENLELSCSGTSRGSPRGRVYWEGPRKLRVGIGISQKSARNPSRVEFQNDFSLKWLEPVSRRDRGYYRLVTTLSFI